MSFRYPRTITITNPLEPTDIAAGSWVGKQPYQAVNRVNEAEVAAGVPASIQYTGAGKGSGGGIPSDARATADWRVLIPRGALAKGKVSERFVVIDDEGKRYQVLAAYWSSLGYNLRATLLQV